MVLGARPKWNDVLERPGEIFTREEKCSVSDSFFVSSSAEHDDINLPYPEWASMAWKRRRVIQM